MDIQTLKNGLKCGCPKCGTPCIFPHKFTLDLKPTCKTCGLNLKEQDCGDGPAVFLIFILGFILVPLALWADTIFIVPLWTHAIISATLAALICLFTMQPTKAYVLAINYKHRGNAHGI